METEFGLRLSDVQAIQAVLSKYPEVEEGFIFGSRVKGTFRPGSDVDMALKGLELTSSVINHITYELNEESRMPYNFDVVNYHTLNEPALKDHIDRLGKRFYSKKE